MWQPQSYVCEGLHAPAPCHIVTTKTSPPHNNNEKLVPCVPPKELPHTTPFIKEILFHCLCLPLVLHLGHSESFYLVSCTRSSQEVYLGSWPLPFKKAPDFHLQIHFLSRNTSPDQWHLRVVTVINKASATLSSQDNGWILSYLSTCARPLSCLFLFLGVFCLHLRQARDWHFK